MIQTINNSYKVSTSAYSKKKFEIENKQSHCNHITFGIYPFKHSCWNKNFYYVCKYIANSIHLKIKYTKNQIKQIFLENQYPSNIICAKYNTFTELNVIMKNLVHVKEKIPKILFKKMEENNTPN